MNECEYIGAPLHNSKPSNYIKASLIEDYDRGSITVVNLAKRYNITVKVAYDIIQEVFPEPPVGKTKVLVYGSAV